MFLTFGDKTSFHEESQLPQICDSDETMSHFNAIMINY